MQLVIFDIDIREVSSKAAKKIMKNTLDTQHNVALLLKNMLRYKTDISKYQNVPTHVIYKSVQFLDISNLLVIEGCI